MNITKQLIGHWHMPYSFHFLCPGLNALFRRV